MLWRWNKAKATGIPKKPGSGVHPFAHQASLASRSCGLIPDTYHIGVNLSPLRAPAPEGETTLPRERAGGFPFRARACGGKLFRLTRMR